MSFANPKLTTIGFDADDTLWQNEQFFRLTEDHFAACLPITPRQAVSSSGFSMPSGEISNSMVSASRVLPSRWSKLR